MPWLARHRLFFLLSIAMYGLSATHALSQFPIPKLVLLDRDGVVNQDVGAPGVVSKTQFQLHDGVGTAIGKLKQHGCRVVIITNQSCVGKGLLDLKGLSAIHEEMRRQLLEKDADANLDQIYFCTSQNDDLRKKPNPGMIIEACSDWKIDSADAVFIGDTLTDMQAAKAGGVNNRILVQTGYGLGLMGNQPAKNPPAVLNTNDLVASQSLMNSVAPFAYARNLVSAVEWILQS